MFRYYVIFSLPGPIEHQVPLNPRIPLHPEAALTYLEKLLVFGNELFGLSRRRGELARHLLVVHDVGVKTSQLKPALETGVFVGRFGAVSRVEPGGAFNHPTACTALP